MRLVNSVKRLLTAGLLLSANLAMTGCSGLNSPLDQAYYTGGTAFSIPGGYTRTIFSTNNF